MGAQTEELARYRLCRKEFTEMHDMKEQILLD
jgi:hypothetical protein